MAVFYESEHTKFMREWLETHPEQRDEKQEGRALWWDKDAKNLDEMRRIEASKVAQKPYVYDIT